MRPRRGLSQQPSTGDRRRTGLPPVSLRHGPTAGVVVHDPAGQLYSLPFPKGPGGTGGTGPVPPTVGNVTTAANIADNHLVRGDGGTVGIQQAPPIAEDDGRISNLTNPTGAQDAATKAYVDATAGAAAASAVGTVPQIMRILGDGATTAFDLLDIAEYLLMIAVNGSIADPATHALSADRSQIVFDVAPTAGHVIVITYIIARV